MGTASNPSSDYRSAAGQPGAAYERYDDQTDKVGGGAVLAAWLLILGGVWSFFTGIDLVTNSAYIKSQPWYSSVAHNYNYFWNLSGWGTVGLILGILAVAAGIFILPPLEPRWPTFGIKLSTAPRPVSNVHNTVSMSRAMVKTMTGFYDRDHIDDATAAARTIVVDTGTVRVTDFDLDRDTQDLLFRKGREATLKFLDGTPGRPAWDWEAYKRTYRSWQTAA